MAFQEHQGRDAALQLLSLSMVRIPRRPWCCIVCRILGSLSALTPITNATCLFPRLLPLVSKTATRRWMNHLPIAVVTCCLHSGRCLRQWGRCWQMFLTLMLQELPANSVAESVICAFLKIRSPGNLIGVEILSHFRCVCGRDHANVWIILEPVTAFMVQQYEYWYCFALQDPSRTARLLSALASIRFFLLSGCSRQGGP